MGTRILAIVVTYFPERDLLNKNISAFINDVDKVLIWENTPGNKKHEYRFITDSKVEYCGDGINSISHALNYAWKYAVSKGYDYLLTMDQDSLFENFSYYVEKSIQSDSFNDVIWTPTLVTSEYPKPLSKSAGITEVKSAITSGMFQKISVISKIGGWNESFAIDGLDDEYVFYAQRIGVKICRVMDAFMNQQYGNPQKVEFLGHSVTLANYSARRYYMIYRSHVQLVRMFPEQKLYKAVYKSHWLGMIKWIFIFEKHKIKKMFSIMMGIFGGHLCNLPYRLS